MYSLAGYGKMISDRVRMNAYASALQQTVKPGSVVLDIGTGTGICALLACQLGARRVFAIEPDDVIHVAREVAAANGYADRIEFIQDLSTRVELPERADVIVSDLRSVLPLFQHHIVSIVDARNRLLARDGVLIPQRDTLWVAMVEAPELYSSHVRYDDADTFGFNMDAARKLTANSWRKAHVRPEQLLVEPRCWATLDYATVQDPNARAEVTWTASRAGTAHGLVVWFDAEIADGVTFSNAPGAPKLIYGNAFFPLMEPVAISEGDSIMVALRATQVGDGYVWQWNSHVRESGEEGATKARFNQSDFFGAPLSLKRLHQQRDNHVPVLNQDGEIDQFILSTINSETSIGDIARRVTARFGERFPRWEDALARVGKLSRQYST